MTSATRSFGFLAFLAVLAIAFVTTTLVACGEETSPSGAPDGEPDAMPEASLPPEGREVDAGVVDARRPYDGSPASVECDAAPCAVALAAGDDHYCAIIADGTVRCWGEPSMLGADSGTPGVPVTVDGVAGAATIAANKDVTCVVLEDGGVECWGARQPSPTRVREVTAAKRVAPGVDISCAVDMDDALVCWGESTTLGKGRRVVDLGDDKATRASVASAAAFVVSSTGVLRSWGNDLGTLGRGTSTVDLIPDKVQGLPKIEEVRSSVRHVCALGSSGDLYCWGEGVLLGTGYIRRELAPVPVSFPSEAYPQQLSVCETHSCARMTDETVYCWGGNNQFGELGQVRPIGVYAPTKVESLEDAVAVAVGFGSSCALSKSGRVHCWGDNEHGQLGRGDSDVRRHPAPAEVVFP